MKAYVRRFRRLGAKVTQRGRRVLDMLQKPSEVDLLMAQLPKVGNAKQLSETVVVITGSSKGIGRVVALAFAAKGARVVVNGRDPAALDHVVQEISAQGGRAVGVCADVSTEAGAHAVLDQAIQAFGQVDVLINNAAVAGPWGVKGWEAGIQEFEETIRANLVGPFACAKYAIDWMIRHHRPGRVVNVSSIATEGNHAGILAYGTSKAALEALTRYLANDLGSSGVTVVTISPHSVRTEAKAARRWDEAELLPPAECLVPAFEHVALAPAHMVHGRIVSTQRFLVDAYAESILASPTAAARRMAYEPMRHHGVVVERDPSAFTLMDRAENRYGPSPKAKAVLAQALTPAMLTYYPDQDYTKLRRVLAAEHALPEEAFVIGNGSWELIGRLVQEFVKPGEEVVSNNPGWFGFNLVCNRRNVALNRVPFRLRAGNELPHHNLEGILNAIGPRTRLVYLISPSNPEGVTLKHDEFANFLERVPPDLPVIVDEAYAEYASDPEMLNTPRLVASSDRTLVGLRTFSKFYGLAGMRIGYAFAKPAFTDLLWRQGQIFNVSGLAEAAATASLTDMDHRADIHAQFTKERQRLFGALNDLGLKHIPSQAPYVLVERVAPLPKLIERFQDAGIYIPNFEFYDGEFIMLPIGTTAENDRNLGILRSLLS
ncbi:MAG TPA: SDR family NAD(P)-dependent oxidoreductase [Candidatus Cybelea sp.]|nr:SDR family NAD(P)-dependent oxidoreductase [Candidatus Cybelea sp.]